MKTWLGIITRTTAIDHLRRTSGEFTGLDEDIAVAQDFDTAVEPLPLPAGVLTDRQREVLELVFRDGLETVDIARRLGVAVPTVRSIKRQALNRLRNHFIISKSGKQPPQTCREVQP